MENSKKMTIAECQVETIKHIENVRKYIKVCTDELTERGIEHDRLKLESPEVEIFTEYTPKLADSTYGSEEYYDFLKGMSEAVQHHYAHYRHHPEHFENGMDDMTLVDLLEMLCDWKASTLRHKDGNLLESIEVNQRRFGYDDRLKQILINTAKMFDEKEKQ